MFGKMKSVSLYAIEAALISALVAGCSSNPSPERAAQKRDAVAVGYGTQDREQVSGAVASVSGEQISRQRATSIEELIRGRVAGVQVLRKQNGEYSVRIRGAGSFVGSGEPLFVIDGIPLAEHNVSTTIATMSPNDVARIDVLKDAGTTAIYGTRGANGVILITTRRSN